MQYKILMSISEVSGLLLYSLSVYMNYCFLLPAAIYASTESTAESTVFGYVQQDEKRFGIFCLFRFRMELQSFSGLIVELMTCDWKYGSGGEGEKEERRERRRNMERLWDGLSDRNDHRRNCGRMMKRVKEMAEGWRGRRTAKGDRINYRELSSLSQFHYRS